MLDGNTSGETESEKHNRKLVLGVFERAALHVD